jgi:hypothetical protein
MWLTNSQSEVLVLLVLDDVAQANHFSKVAAVV